MKKAAQLTLFPSCGGERVWRAEVNKAPAWQPTQDDRQAGARTHMRDGIYIVTVNQETPTKWFELAWKATVIASGQHPEWGFIPMDNYDSAVAVHRRQSGRGRVGPDRKAVSLLLECGAQAGRGTI